MANQSKHTSPEQWESLVEGFRSFGGIATNVVQREGEFGLGIFAVDPSKPVELRVPEHLLVATNNVELSDGNVVLKDESSYPEGFGDWYKMFQSKYSWGAEAQTSIRNFEVGLKSLTNKTRELLRNFGLAVTNERFPGENEEQDIFKRFILTRQISFNENLVLMPMIELVNHSPDQTSWIMDDSSISINGSYNGEVLVRYSVNDPLRRVLQYGFNCKEHVGFSISTKLNHRGKVVYVRGGVNFSHLQKPNVTFDNNIIKIDRPLLGSKYQPRMPRTLFRDALSNQTDINPDELFDQIVIRNRAALVQAIRQLQTERSTTGEQLLEGCMEQLVAISQHYGSRPSDKFINQTAM